MYEPERNWNMEELVQWNDDYTITLGEEGQQEVQRDDCEEEAMMLTNQECEILGKFLQQEALDKPKVFCQTCSEKQCDTCDNLRNRYSEEDQAVYRQM